MKRTVIFFFFFFGLSICSSAQYIVGKHDSKAKDFANSCASNLQQNISPNTGRDSYGVVKQWVYDEYKNRYEITMEAYWSAKLTMMGSERNTCEIDGILTVNDDGRGAQFTTTYKNSWVKRIESSNRFINGSAIALGVLYISTQD
jgi:hypothetical protein